MTLNAPMKGDIVLLNFNPQAGHEQAGYRPALVVSPQSYNKHGLCFVCPITNQKKGYPFEVEVKGAKKTTGVILSDHMKSIDWIARGAKIIDSVNQQCLINTLNLIDLILKEPEI